MNDGVMLKRSALMRQIDKMTGRQLVYLYAPAGYGKSMTAEMWLSRQGYPWGRVSLDEYDNKPAVFVRRVCRLLCLCQPGNMGLARAAETEAPGTAPFEQVLRTVEALDTGDRGGILLDDFHLLQNGALLRMLTAMLKRLPGSIQVLVASRNPPPAELAELLMKRRLGVVDAEALRFTREETGQYFKVVRQSLAPTQLDKVYALTSGWPMGVYTAAQHVGGAENHYLAEKALDSYFETQVWQPWTEDIREFLALTAFEDELTGELCDALTQNEDSASMLDALADGCAFIEMTESGSYRRQRQFHSFLLGKVEGRGPGFQLEQIRRAGDWYHAGGVFHKAVEAYAKCKDTEAIVHSFDLLETRDFSVFVIEEILPTIDIVRQTGIAEDSPRLYYLLAWGDFCHGDAESMYRHMDLYYGHYPEIVKKNPEIGYNIFFLKCIDMRNSLYDTVLQVEHTGGVAPTSANSSSMSLNMPLFHRSARDFSEYAACQDMPREILRLKAALGNGFGIEQDLYAACLAGGLLYEQSKLDKALEHALQANAEIRPDTAPEAQFCAMALLVNIYRAMWQYDKARTILNRMYEMAGRHDARYLEFNVSAFAYKCYLESGDTAAAREWLQRYGASPYDPIEFYKLFGYLTTCRAYIALGEYESAIILLKKILAMGTQMKRPLDVIEAQILLSICYWKRKRGNQAEALAFLEQAVISAHPYGYVQRFANESADMVNMLHRLQGRATRSNYSGKLPGQFTKKLYMHVLEQARHTKGLTGGQPQRPISFTEKQKTVMRLLCEGNSYRGIAEHMGIKFTTVRSHIELIYKKLDVGNETAAVMKIKELELLED